VLCFAEAHKAARKAEPGKKFLARLNLEWFFWKQKYN
jgi:hypothetical protein